MNTLFFKILNVFGLFLFFQLSAVAASNSCNGINHGPITSGTSISYQDTLQKRTTDDRYHYIDTPGIGTLVITITSQERTYQIDVGTTCNGSKLGTQKSDKLKTITYNITSTTGERIFTSHHTDTFGNINLRKFTVTFEFTATNTPPNNISLSNSKIDENQVINTDIGTFLTTDADVTDTHTYTLVSGTGDTDNESFTISDNTLKSNEVFDYETKSSYTIRVQTKDEGGATFEKVFSIDINNISEISSEPLFDPNCGLFPSVLTSYEHLTMQKNPVIQSCYISYPLGEFTDGSILKPTCYVDSAMSQLCIDEDGNSDNGNCNYIPPPTTRYSHITIDSSIGSSTNNNDNSIELTDYEYGNINFSSNAQTIHFNPSQTYSGDSDRKVMIMGDIILSANNQILSFEEGDYYFKNLDFQNSGVIIQTKGDVKFFISQDFIYAGNGADVTDSSSSLFVYVAGNVNIASTGGGNGWLGMFIYAKGDITVASNSNSKFFGGITAEGRIDVTGNNFEFEYNKDGANSLGMGECVYVEFSEASYSFREPAVDGNDRFSIYEITVELNKPLPTAVSVTYEIYDDSPLETFSAEEFIDYRVTIPPNSQTLVFLAGETSKAIQITVLRDDLIELAETFHAKLTNPSPSPYLSLGKQWETELTIEGQDDDDVPLCFSDNFNAELDNKWRTIFSSGGFTPKIVDDRLRLTDRQKNLATAVTKDYEFLAQHNLIIVEFEQYAYGGCEDGQSTTKGGGLGNEGADGIVMVLFDSTSPSTGETLVSPEPGAYGGSMGYAQGHSKKGFEAGWLGLGIDEYGNFINPTEGRDGGLGFYPNNVTIRGASGELINGGTRNSGYTYLSSNKNLPNKVASKLRSPAYPGHKYKLRIDARDPSKLLVQLEQDSGNGYATIIPSFDAKTLNDADSPEYVRLALTSGTGGGCNNHEIDELSVRGVCRPYNPLALATGYFDAWDIFRDVDDRNISTKIVNKDFQLTIASLNEDNNGMEVKEDIVIQYRLYDDENAVGINDWTDYNASTGSDGAFADKLFNDISTAHKDTKVQFKFCGLSENGVTLISSLDTCNPDSPDYDGTYSHKFTVSTDNFAIRPKEFHFIATPATLRAGNSVTFDFLANDEDNNKTADYNETQGVSFSIDINESKPACITGDFSPLIDDGWDFSDGNYSISTSYNEVGILGVSIAENDGNEYAFVDRDDTAAIERLITPYSDTITFLADHFNITATLSDNGSNFTYLSRDLNVSAKLDLNITAQAADNNTTQNYNSACYAQAVDYNVTYTTTTLNPSANLSRLLYKAYQGSTLLADANVSIGDTLELSLANTVFATDTNGSAITSLQINFDRDKNRTINPFRLSLNNINTINADATFGTKNYTDQNATFIYGRTNSPRSRFKANANQRAFIYYEAYCEGAGCDKTLLPNSTTSAYTNDPRWYINSLHTNISGTAGTVTQKGTANLVSQVSPASGTHRDFVGLTYDGTKGNPYKATMENNASSWLIYNRYDATDTTNEFEVEFEGGSSDWAGKQESDITTIESGTTQVNRRSMW